MIRKEGNVFVLIHGSRSTKNYIKNIKIDYTGIDVTYCDKENAAMKFVSRSVAIQITKILINYGNFYPKEIETGG